MSGMPTSPEYRASFAAFGVKNCANSATGCPSWTRLSYSSRYSSNSQETQQVCGCTSCPYTYTNDARYAHVSEYSYGTVASSHSYCNAGSINSATGSGYFSYITMNCGCGAWEWTASCSDVSCPANSYWDTSANKAFCSSGYQVTGQSNGLRELTNGVGIVVGTCFATPCSYA